MDLNFREYGNASTTIMILHGLLGSSLNWNSAAKKLGKQFHVLVPDQRNHGDSPHGPHSIELLSQDIARLLDRLSLDKTLLIGHSMGGLAAMAFACSNPERLTGLVVVDIAPLAKLSLSRMNTIFETLLAVDLSRVTSRNNADEQLSTTIESPLVRQFLLQNLKRLENGSYTWRCNLAELQSFTQKDTPFRTTIQAKYDGPTLFVGGELSEHRIQDQKEIIAGYFPNYQLKMIANVGHWVHFEAMETFLATVTDFINGIKWP